MFDYRQRQPAQPAMMGPDFAATPTPQMQQSDLINQVMAAHPQGGSMQSAVSMLGPALAGLGANKGNGPAAPDHAQPAQPDTPEMPHSGAGLPAPLMPAHSFGGAPEMGDGFMPRKRPPFQQLGSPMDMTQLLA